MLHSEPSFSIFSKYNDELEDEAKNEADEKESSLTRTATIGEIIEAKGSGEFCFGNNTMGLIKEEGEEEQEEEALKGIENLSIEEQNGPVSPRMYLAAGLGIDGIEFGSDGSGGYGVDLTLPNFDGSDDVEGYYKRMIHEYPCHPLFLSNYARLLQAKGDLQGAEEFYHRATLADPEDGEVLMQHAKLEWELHHDKDRALANFERAVQAAPHNSHVLAANASFLWEIDEDEERTSQVGAGSLNKLVNQSTNTEITSLQLPAEHTIDAEDHVTSETNKDGNIEDYHHRMVEENPYNSLVLRNYAEYLYQAKGDLHAAEEYYSRAIQADPGDGEIMAQYAKVVWELHHDRDKALCYFERAVQLTPENSCVLGAYASFLWDLDGNEDDGVSQFEAHNHDGGALAAAANA